LSALQTVFSGAKLMFEVFFFFLNQKGNEASLLFVSFIIGDNLDHRREETP